MIMWLLSDRAIPRSYRMMEGFGVNTFRFVNAKGRGCFVKFHWKSLLGVHSLVWDEAQKLAGKDPDYHRRDLWDAINKGDFPEYELGVQILDEDQEFDFDFDILDATKIWPEETVPVKRIGKMTLNRNADNFFAETEQVAFCIGNVVPGIDFSNDPLLQGRLFSYLDTQIIRLGGPNFHEIPINRPLAHVHNNQRDGYHRMSIDHGRVSYFPNSLQNGTPQPDVENGYIHYTEKVDGRKVRERSHSFKDFYSQATLFWNSMSPIEKQHIVEAFHFEIGGVVDKQIRQRVVDMFNNVNADLAKQIAQGIGANSPVKPGGTGITATSPAISQMNTPKSAATRKVAILAENGFNFPEITQVIEELKKAKVHTDIISKNQGMLTSTEGRQIEANKNYLTAGSIMYDALYITGGRQNADSLLQQGDAIHFINEAFKHAKTIGATNEGVDLLEAAQIPGIPLARRETHAQIVNEMGVLTIRNAADMSFFAGKFIEAMAQHRHWIRQKEKELVPA